MLWLAAELPPDIPPACVQQAAEHYGLPTVALVAVLKQEAGEVGKAYPRGDRTYFGPAQISDLWLPHFAKFGWTLADIQSNPCINIAAGAYILAYYQVREKDLVRAIARYNVGSLDKPQQKEAGNRYVRKVLAHWTGIRKKWLGN